MSLDGMKGGMMGRRWARQHEEEEKRTKDWI